MQSAVAVPADGLRAAFNEAFADYLIGPPNLRNEDWPLFLRRQGIDLEPSLVQTAGDGVLAFALLCPIGADRVRLASMGAIPAARGSGAAPHLLDEVMAQARAGGALSFELEVFAQNTRALNLYQSRGFETVAELFGYERAPGAADAPTEPPQPVDRTDAIAWLRALALDNLPFQVSAAAVQASTAPLVAWRSHAAQLVFNARDEASVRVISLVDTDAAQAGTRVLGQALAFAYPQATLRVPQLQRADLGGRALEALGWTRLPLHQLLMRRAW